MSTRTAIKCNCPRGMFSPNCKIPHHRAIADQINCIFVNTKGNNSGTGRKRRPRGVEKRYRRRDWKSRAEFCLVNLFDSGKLQRGILVLLIGMLLVMLGSQVYMRVTDSRSIAQVIGSQIGR